jgi:group I intron endonuclease
MYIYLITELSTGKYYVGKREKDDLLKYFKSNVNAAIRGSNLKPYLYRAIRKYGIYNFVIDVLATSDDKEQLSQLERLWIILLDARNPLKGYNIAFGGNGGDTGYYNVYKRTQEHKDAVRIRMLGKRLALGFKRPDVSTRLKTNNPQKRRIVCKNGHQLTDQNVYIRPDRNSRSCRLCNNERSKVYHGSS